MVGGLLPCAGCRRHVRATERSCPFCGVGLEARETIAELRLLTPLDRSRLVALGAVLSAAGIAFGCREPAVAVYGAPPSDGIVSPAPSTEPPAALPAPSAAAAPSASVVVEPPPAASSSVLVPAPKPTPTAKPAPTQKRGPDQMLAPAYGGPPRDLPPELDPKSR